MINIYDLQTIEICNILQLSRKLTSVYIGPTRVGMYNKTLNDWPHGKQ